MTNLQTAHFKPRHLTEAYELACSPDFDGLAVVVDGLIGPVSGHSLTSAIKHPEGREITLCETLQKVAPGLSEAWRTARLRLSAELAGELAIRDEIDATECSAGLLKVDRIMNAPSEAEPRVKLLHALTPLNGLTHFQVRRFGSVEEIPKPGEEFDDTSDIIAAKAGDHIILPGAPRPTLARLMVSMPGTILETSMSASQKLALIA